MKLKWKKQLKNRLWCGVWSKIGVWKDGGWFPVIDGYTEEDEANGGPIFCFSHADYSNLTMKEINIIIRQLEEIIVRKRSNLELPIRTRGVKGGKDCEKIRERRLMKHILYGKVEDQKGREKV